MVLDLLLELPDVLLALLLFSVALLLLFGGLAGLLCIALLFDLALESTALLLAAFGHFLGLLDRVYNVLSLLIDSLFQVIGRSTKDLVKAILPGGSIELDAFNGFTKADGGELFNFAFNLVDLDAQACHFFDILCRDNGGLGEHVAHLIARLLEDGDQLDG